MPALPAGPITLTARARDVNGRERAQSKQVVMLAAPDVSIASAKRHGKHGKQVRVPVTAGGRDLGTRQVALQERVGGRWREIAVNSREPWTFTVRAGRGAHVYRAVATDGAGASGASPAARVEKRLR